MTILYINKEKTFKALFHRKEDSKTFSSFFQIRFKRKRRRAFALLYRYFQI